MTIELPSAAGWIRPVNDVSLQIGAGECLGLVGESGSGKTMLSLALMGLLPPGARVSGEIRLRIPRAGKAGGASDQDAETSNLVELTEEEWRSVRGAQIAMIFQEPMTSLNPVLRIGVPELSRGGT